VVAGWVELQPVPVAELVELLRLEDHAGHGNELAATPWWMANGSQRAFSTSGVVLASVLQRPPPAPSVVGPQREVLPTVRLVLPCRR
jgi:hypothetical protein